MRNVAPKPEILNRVFILHVVEKWSVGDTHESGFLSSEKGNMWFQKLARVFRRHHIFLSQDYPGKVEDKNTVTLMMMVWVIGQQPCPFYIIFAEEIRLDVSLCRS